MNKSFLAAIAALMFVLTTTSADALVISKCTAEARNDITAAHNFVKDRMDDVVSKFTMLNTRQKDEFDRKWDRLRVDCEDNRSKCLRKPGVGGFAHGGLGNRVNICYSNMIVGYPAFQSRSAEICDLVETMVHEAGHANGFPKSKGHNGLSDAEKLNDPIYQMGFAILDFCNEEADAGRFANQELSGAADLAIGDQCTFNDQCQSGKCGSKGKCVCNDDGDCPGAQECFKPLGKTNYCSSVNLDLGASCSKNDHCKSNKCEKDICVCKDDGDCPGSQTCKTPIGKANYCEASSSPVLLDLGASCSKNNECKSDKCEKDSCVCKDDGDCPGTQSCYTPIGKANYCSPTSKGLGQSCSKNSQCKSNKCEKDTCVCKNNSDCPSGQKCKTPIGKANYCKL